MRVNEINGMAIYDTSDFEQDERSFQPLIYLEIVLSTVSSDIHVGFHVALNGIERMGISSSSGLSRIKWSGG